MRTFVDTSALFALLDEDDINHEAAGQWLTGIGRDSQHALISHNYVVVETAALVHRRLGPAATRVFFDAFVPAMSIFYVDEDLHQRAVAAYVASVSRALSLVDRVSFQVIRDLGLEQAFAFDRDFKTEGFNLVP